MKTLAVLIVVMISHILPFRLAQEEAIEQAANRQHVLVVKVDRKFKGGEVEVLAQSGHTVVKQVLFRSKMRIDFCNVKPGTYIVKMKKGRLVEEFQYQRR